jgi:hypothetical protein
MIKDGQVRRLRRLLSSGASLALAARKSGMDEKTARKYRDGEGLPSDEVKRRTWRTRKDPFVDVWPKVEARLQADSELRAFALFEWLQDQHPGQFPDSQRRTFERRVRAWRAGHGPNQEVMFPQVHFPGDLGASDFTRMNSLGVTIGGQPFDHMLYHFTLTYSNWESVSICFSESFEAFSRGLQDAFWKVGGVPRRHRSDSLSAAVNNLSDERDFGKRYQDLLDYYRVEPQRTNARRAHENGDVESSHGHLKRTVEQALLLRGSRDFASREDYQQFLDELMDKRNGRRSRELQEEQAEFGELPPNKLDHRMRIRDITVRSSSTIQVKRNTYSVHSRLIGHQVEVLIDADTITVWHGDVEVQQMPRLLGSGKHAINYRHVIDSLFRKPGAFENYKYREDMFPTSHFRIAYDWLCRDHSPRVAAREYLKILQLAARDSQDAVQDALRLAISNNAPILAESVRSAVEQHQQAPPVTDVSVETPDLKQFDLLLQFSDMEVDSYECEQEFQQQGEEEVIGSVAGERKANQRQDDDRKTDGTIPGASTSHVPGALCQFGGQRDQGIDQSSPVSPGADQPGMPGPPGKQDRPPHAAIQTSHVEDVEQFRLEASPASTQSANGESPRRYVSEPSREPPTVWQAGDGQEPLSMCLGGTIGSAGAFCPVY